MEQFASDPSLACEPIEWSDENGDSSLQPYSPQTWDLLNAFESSDLAAVQAEVGPSSTGVELDHSDWLLEDPNSIFCTAWNEGLQEVEPRPDQTIIMTNNIQTSLDTFLNGSSARLSPVPCTLCATNRLQCLILQTTTANPNPVSSCSSCVALFRECSLALGEKRPPAQFETSAPVIGHLHGVSEEDAAARLLDDKPDLELHSVGPTKSSTSRMSRHTKPLRQWFSTHQNDPYPSKEEKEILIERSGLSSNQVANWFTNARRRQRQSARMQRKNRKFPAGSPMPRSPLSSSPLERWRNSPPEDDHVSLAMIEAALSSSDQSSVAIYNRNARTPSDSGRTSHTGSVGYSPSTASRNSSASESSWRSTDVLSVCASHDSSDQIPRATLNRSKRKAKSRMYECTFCRKSFTKRHDWKRHERIHMPSLERYVCQGSLISSLVVWRLDSPEPQCSLCGHNCPDDVHFQSHEFDTCSERRVLERSFSRRDHLWQHLVKYHGCRKWDGWSLDLDLWKCRNDVVESHCGFCGLQSHTWHDRTDHLAKHFEDGLRMEQWNEQFVAIEPHLLKTTTTLESSIAT